MTCKTCGATNEGIEGPCPECGGQPKPKLGEVPFGDVPYCELARLTELYDDLTAERVRVEELERRDDAWKEASGLERGGDPEAITPQDAQEHWGAVAQASQDLMAEVAMLLLDVPRLRETRKRLVEVHDRLAKLVGE